MSSSWCFVDLFFFLLFYYICFCMSFLFKQYLYFFSVGLLFGTISLVGWLGFTLSFLILLILYSTLVVVFWSFFVAFEDQKAKSEKKKTSSSFVALSFVWLFPNTPGSLHLLSALLPVFILNFFQTTETNEFFFFFLIIYVFNPLMFLFIFFTLVLVCFNIVSLLLLKQKSTHSVSIAAVNFNQVRSGLANKGYRGRKGFWSTVSSNLSFLSLGKSN